MSHDLIIALTISIGIILIIFMLVYRLYLLFNKQSNYKDRDKYYEYITKMFLEVFEETNRKFEEYKKNYHSNNKG